MKKIIFTFLSFIVTLPVIYAQKGINFSSKYAAGGKLLICVDSSAKNVFYNNVFPNQPHTSFNYLPEVNNVSIQIYFRKEDSVQQYRYTILVDNKPMVVNQSFKNEQMKDIKMPEIYRSTSIGIFPIKGKIITILVYNIEKPLDIYKSVFYGKPIPKAKIKGFAKRFKIDKGVDYNWTTDPKDTINLVFTEKDDELTIVKDRSNFDYLYYTSIKDKQTNETIFESTAWKYGGLVEEHEFLPYINIDKNVFKKSGDYEIIIQPLIKWTGCINCDISKKEIEQYTSRYLLSITLDEENYTKKELFTYTIIIAFSTKGCKAST